MSKKIIKPTKGIDTDSALNRRSDSTIYMAKNLRLNSDEEITLGQYTNIKGPNVILNSTISAQILKIDKVSDDSAEPAEAID